MAKLIKHTEYQTNASNTNVAIIIKVSRQSNNRNKMHNISKAFFYAILTILTMALTIVSCTTDEAEDLDDINKQTILVFMPWSGSQTSSGLYSYFLQNLDSIESAIKTAGTMSGRVMVFLSTSADESNLYEITYNDKEIQHNSIKSYQGNLYATSEGITQILNDAQGHAPALNYAMIIGCHGCGWTFKEDWEQYPYYSKPNTHSLANGRKALSPKTASDGANAADGLPMTRFYGSVNDKAYATDITTLAQGISGAGMTMQYILFDDCYMANIETAYELKNTTRFLIGSTSEIMAVGMPYKTMWASLASPTPAYATAVTAFNTFYTNYQYPYGTISAIDCRKLDEVASRMRMINERYALADSLVDSLQVLDGFHEPIFYDFGHYVSLLCKNNDMLNDFNSALNSAVKSSAHTESIYTHIYYGESNTVKVNHFSGLTISDPSRNSVALKGKKKTAWWKATH